MEVHETPPNYFQEVYEIILLPVCPHIAALF
jgi:hypothetical protein